MCDAIMAEMQSIIRAAAEPWSPGDSAKAAIRRAARNTGLTFRRARTFWYGESAAVRAAEADALRAWHAEWLETQAERLERQAAEYRARKAEIASRWGNAGNALAAVKAAKAAQLARDVGDHIRVDRRADAVDRQVLAGHQ